MTKQPGPPFYPLVPPTLPGRTLTHKLEATCKERPRLFAQNHPHQRGCSPLYSSSAARAPSPGALQPAQAQGRPEVPTSLTLPFSSWRYGCAGGRAGVRPTASRSPHVLLPHPQLPPGGSSAALPLRSRWASLRPGSRLEGNPLLREEGGGYLSRTSGDAWQPVLLHRGEPHDTRRARCKMDSRRPAPPGHPGPRLRATGPASRRAFPRDPRPGGRPSGVSNRRG